MLVLVGGGLAPSLVDVPVPSEGLLSSLEVVVVTTKALLRRAKSFLAHRARVGFDFVDDIISEMFL